LAVIFLLAGYLGLQHYLGTIKKPIDEVAASPASLHENSDKLKPDLERFKTLDGDIAALNVKLAALSKITTSKMGKYKPIIVLEHFQNLKPEGVWFKSVKLGSGGADDFDLVGSGLDNLLVAEFLTALRATESQEKDAGDLRTQIGFSDLALEETQVGANSSGGGGGADWFPEMARFPVFHIKGKFVERTDPDANPQRDLGAPAPAPSQPLSEAPSKPVTAKF
jgi:hypothetical protein